MNWHEIVGNEKEPCLDIYPKLHFYDLVYIHHYCEKRDFRVTEEVRKVSINLPFFPSLKYALSEFKRTYIDP